MQDVCKQYDVLFKPEYNSLYNRKGFFYLKILYRYFTPWQGRAQVIDVRLSPTPKYFWSKIPPPSAPPPHQDKMLCFPLHGHLMRWLLIMSCTPIQFSPHFYLSVKIGSFLFSSIINKCLKEINFASKLKT